MNSSTDSNAKKFQLKVDVEKLSIQFLNKTKVRNYVLRNRSKLKDKDTESEIDCNGLPLNKLVDQYMKIYNKLRHESEPNDTEDYILLDNQRDEAGYLQIAYNRVQEYKNRKLEKEKSDPTIGNKSSFVLFFFLKDENGELKSIVAATSGSSWEVVRGCCETSYPIKILEQVASTDKNIVKIEKRALFGKSTTETFSNVHLNEMYNTSSLYCLVENITCEVDEKRGSTLLKIIAQNSTSSDVDDEEEIEKSSDLSLENNSTLPTSHVTISFNDVSVASTVLDESPNKAKRPRTRVQGKESKKKSQKIFIKITTGGIVRIDRKVQNIESYGEIIMCLNEYALKELEDKRFNFLYFTEVAKERKSDLDDKLIERIFERFHKNTKQIVTLRHARFDDFLLSDKFSIQIHKRSRYEEISSELPDMGKILAWIEEKQQTERVSRVTSGKKVSTSVAKRKLEFKNMMKGSTLRATKQSSQTKLEAKLIDYIEGEIVHNDVQYFKIRMKWYRIDVDYLSLMQQDFEAVRKVTSIGPNDNGYLPLTWKKKSCLSKTELGKILNTTDLEKITLLYGKLEARNVNYILDNRVVKEQLVGEILKKKEIRQFKNLIELTLKRFFDSSIQCSEKKWNEFLQEEHLNSSPSKRKMTKGHLKIIWEQLTKSRKIVKKLFQSSYVINPIFYGFEDDLDQLKLTDYEYNSLIHYLEFCAREQDEGEYNMCYMNEDLIGTFVDHYYLVFDKVCPDNIEPCDIFDYTEETIYLYHVKADFGQQTRDVCSQIFNSAVFIQAALKTNQMDNYLKKLWIKANENLKDEEDQRWRLKLHAKLRSLGEQNFMNLFYTKSIVFVYAYLASEADETIDDLKTIPDGIYDLCQKLGYINKSGNLTNKISIKKKKEFTKELVAENSSIDKGDCDKTYKIIIDRHKILEIVNNSCKELGFTNKCGSLTTKFFDTTRDKFVQEVYQKNPKFIKRHCEGAFGILKRRKFSNSWLAKIEVLHLADKFNAFTKQFEFKMCEIPKEKYHQLTQSST